MAAPKSLLNYLDKGGIKYELVPHKKVYTAYDLAQTLGAKLDSIAKTVLVKVELPQVKKKGQYYILVLPASYRANFKKLKKELKAKRVQLVSERDFKKLKVKPGAVTPFGAYHKLGVLIDKSLMKTQKAFVSAGSYTDALRVKVKDLHTKEGAILGNFSDKTKLKLQKVAKKAKKAVKKAKGTAERVKKAVKPPKRKMVPGRKKKAAKKKVAPKRKKVAPKKRVPPKKKRKAVSRPRVKTASKRKKASAPKARKSSTFSRVKRKKR